MAKINLGPNSSSINFYGNGGGGGGDFELETFTCSVDETTNAVSITFDQGRSYLSSKLGEPFIIASGNKKCLIWAVERVQNTLRFKVGGLAERCYLQQKGGYGSNTFDFVDGQLLYVNPFDIVSVSPAKYQLATLSHVDTTDGQGVLCCGHDSYTMEWRSVKTEAEIEGSPVGGVIEVDLSYIESNLLGIIAQLKAGLSQTTEVSVIANNVSALCRFIIDGFKNKVATNDYPILKVGYYKCFVSDFYEDDDNNFTLSYCIKEIDSGFLYTYDFTVNNSSIVVVGRKVSPTPVS